MAFEHQFIPLPLNPVDEDAGPYAAGVAALGLGVDLANATGWPFGGPWVSDEDASKTIYCKIFQVPGGGRLAEPVEYYREGWAARLPDSCYQPIPSGNLSLPIATCNRWR